MIRLSTLGRALRGRVTLAEVWHESGIFSDEMIKGHAIFRSEQLTLFYFQDGSLGLQQAEKTCLLSREEFQDLLDYQSGLMLMLIHCVPHMSMAQLERYNDFILYVKSYISIAASISTGVPLQSLEGAGQ